MKKSNIIIIAFGLFLIGGMLVLYVDSTHHKNDENTEITKTKEVMLPPFSVIVAEKGSDLHIEQSDTNKLTIEYFPEKKIPSNLYAISGDTLRVYSGLRLFVKCCRLKTIIGNKHKWIGLNDFLSDSISVRMSGGEMTFHNENLNEKYFKAKKEPKLMNMNLIGKDSAQINVFNVNLDHLNIDSDSAFMNISSRVHTLNADLVRHSKFEICSEYKMIVIKKDSTCTFFAEQ